MALASALSVQPSSGTELSMKSEDTVKVVPVGFVKTPVELTTIPLGICQPFSLAPTPLIIRMEPTLSADTRGVRIGSLVPILIRTLTPAACSSRSNAAKEIGKLLFSNPVIS